MPTKIKKTKLDLFDIVPMTPKEASATLFKEMSKDDPDYALIQNIVQHSKIDINLQDEHSKTALMHAVDADSPEIVEILLKARANPHLEDRDGNTALMRAADWGSSIEIVEMLMKAGSDGFYAENKDGENALQIAKKRNHIEIADLIYEYMVK
jgi:serine/threonine-protein phosphatase 6 regulatory ankyrin repeat subunit B